MTLLSDSLAHHPMANFCIHNTGFWHTEFLRTFAPDGPFYWAYHWPSCVAFNWECTFNALRMPFLHKGQSLFKAFSHRKGEQGLLFLYSIEVLQYTIPKWSQAHPIASWLMNDPSKWFRAVILICQLFFPRKTRDCFACKKTICLFQMCYILCTGFEITFSKKATVFTR